MKKIRTCFLSIILYFILMYIPNNTIEAYTVDTIENNTIKFLTYEYPVDLKTKVLEFKFVDQGNNTAKLKCYSNGRFIKIDEIKSNLALYNDLTLTLTNIYGYSDTDYLDRGLSMRAIARYLESLTFTYGVDTIQIARVPIIFHHSKEGYFTFGYGGKIQGNLNNRDFNDALMFYSNGKEWRFRVRRNGLHAEYLKQTRLVDGEYYIETADSSNRVLDVLPGGNVGINDYNPNSNSQKVTLEFDKVNYATRIKFKGVNKYLRFDKGNGNNVIASEKMTNRDIGEYKWYLVDNGNGTYRIVSSRKDIKYLNLDANNTNISVTDKKKNTKQLFKIVKASERKSIFDSNVKIVSKLNSNKVLNVHIGTGDARNITIWDDAGVTQQRFKFEYDANKNAYRIRDAYHNGYLAWTPGSSRNVGTHKGNYTNSGYWILEYAGSGYYYIKSLHNQNVVLDVTARKTANGTNIAVSKKHGGDNQKFKLVY